MMITQSSRVSKQTKRFFSLALASQVSQAQSIPFPQSAKVTDHKKVRGARFRPVESYPRYRNDEDFFVPFGLVTPKDRYHFSKSENRVGDGMFATVYKALDVMTKKPVAVKVINKSTCPKQVYKQELRVMSQIKAALGSSQLTDLPLGLSTDILETSEELRLVFPLKTGGDLLEELLSKGAVTESEAKVLMKRLVPALAALHKNGFVHRDIKPENILLDSHESRSEFMNSATLSDYGYAKKVNEKDSFNNPAGTFGYVAPEVLSSKIYTPACDVWSLGTVLFTAVAAYLPFPSNEPELKQKSSQNIVQRDLKAITEGSTEIVWEKEFSQVAFAEVSQEFKDLLRSMLEFDHTKRISVEDILSHPWYTSEIEDNNSQPQQATL